MTLMEVLIAMMLLAVVAVVIFSAFSIGLRAAALAGGMNTATGIAEETLALLTASPCGSWTQARMQRSVTLTTLRHVSAACAYTGQ
jgi:hypothetical protein